MCRRLRSHLSRFSYAALVLLCCLSIVQPAARAEGTSTTGEFQGVVRDKVTEKGISRAQVEIISLKKGTSVIRTTDFKGRFNSGMLEPGVYRIIVSSQNYESLDIEEQELSTLRANEVVTLPQGLQSKSAKARAPSSPKARAPSSPRRAVRFVKTLYFDLTPLATPAPAAGQSGPGAASVVTADQTLFRGSMYRTDGRRDGTFTKEVPELPLGSTTLVRTFDELALVLPGVAPPPETIGNGVGPGVGAGVGSSGQFAVNGLRSRANNFTVDGSDNNDEDIGVRRQGFLQLIPQPVESIQEYQVITLLAPAQYGRNLGGWVNAVSKSGGKDFHGTLFGSLNSSRLNSRHFFDTTNGDAVSPLTAGGRRVVQSPDLIVNPGDPVCQGQSRPRCLRDSTPILVRNQSGGEDSLTFAQGGLVLGGPLGDGGGGKAPSMFYFISAEGHAQHATKEANFAVPTVAQRGVFGTGATGNFNLQLLDQAPFIAPLDRFTFPTSQSGSAVFSLFPFPNNEAGVYGPNTFTQSLPSDAEGFLLSGKFDGDFKLSGRQQSFTARYNFTDDWRDLPVTGGAIFSSLRPSTRTQNLSTFLNSELSDPDAAGAVYNQLRLSYGRTRLDFEQHAPPPGFLIPSRFSDPAFGSFGLLNANLIENVTTPVISGSTLAANTGDVYYLLSNSGSASRSLACKIILPVRPCTTEDVLGPVGQVVIAGFSPVGLDVFTFPQRRVNNTYQLADIVAWRAGGHSLNFGVDARRTELNSDLPRNARTLLTFYGAVRPSAPSTTRGVYILPGRDRLRPEDLAAAGAASGSFLTLNTTGDSKLNLRYYQWNFFAQDAWRARSNLALSYGLRYEYNTPPRETSRRIEDTFDSPDLNLVPGLRSFMDGRTRIFEPDRNNFAPRVGLAYSPNLFDAERATVIRLGYGLFYDQILGAVVSQSRNVFPTFVTVNLAGGFANLTGGTLPMSVINPSVIGITRPNTINAANLSPTDPTCGPPASPRLCALLNRINRITSVNGRFPGVSGAGVTLPVRDLSTPLAHHYALTVEQQLGARHAVSVAYVGTQGRKLLRFTTPNLGQNAFLVLQTLDRNSTAFPQPAFFGLALPPGARSTAAGFSGGRPNPQVGAVNLFETSANSSYNALQVELRGHLARSLQYQTAYTFSKASDDVSDVFDLAGASALPQNSFDLAAERGPANFDVRHRVTYFFTYRLPQVSERRRALRLLLGGLEFAGKGEFRTGQPFTVNSIFDINLDGNLTDRLDSTGGLLETGSGRQPLRLTGASADLLAPVGRDGSVGRNSFRSGSILSLDFALQKYFLLTEDEKGQRILLRVEVFNLLNRANFGVPVRFLEAPGFGRATDTVTPGRRAHLSLKYLF